MNIERSCADVVLLASESHVMSKEAALHVRDVVTCHLGLREPVTEMLRDKADPSDLPPEEQDIVLSMRQLMRTNRIEPSVFDAFWGSAQRAVIG